MRSEKNSVAISSYSEQNLDLKKLSARQKNFQKISGQKFFLEFLSSCRNFLSKISLKKWDFIYTFFQEEQFPIPTGVCVCKCVGSQGGNALGRRAEMHW